MRPFLEIAELTTDQPEKFAVLSIDPTQPNGDGCRAVVMSLHFTHEDARTALANSEGKANV